MQHNGHLKHMLLGGGVLLVGMLLLGFPLATAFSYAAVLACPLMMVWMMLTMSGSHGQAGNAPISGAADSHRDNGRASSVRSR